MSMGSPLRKARVAALSALVSIGMPAQAQSPDEALHAFYTWVLAHPSRGLPSAGERRELAKVLSPALIESLEAASATEAKCVAAAPKGDKPYIVEGDMFVGNYEGATEVAYGKPRRDADTVIVESDLYYVDNRFPKAHKHRAVGWRDRVEMRFSGARWYVVDVHFHPKRSLLATLKSYIAEGARTCAVPERSKRGEGDRPRWRDSGFPLESERPVEGIGN